MALILAEKGKGYTTPNPLVGAVIVKNNQVIGQGYHEKAGGAHAEVHAINYATESVQGSTLYVTLEPCAHFGKTPPCTDLIIKSKINHVVIAATDPNPLVSGKGIDRLRAAGIKVTTGVLAEESHRLNEIFNKYIATQLPFVTMKYAMTLDGKIATESGSSKWISSPMSRTHAHQLRGEMSAIMVGIETVIKDDPKLTCRVQGYSSPLRIVLDSQLRIPEQSQVLKDQSIAQTLIVTTEAASPEKMKRLKNKNIEIISIPQVSQRIDLRRAMQVLGDQGIDSILLEGGGTVNAAALEAGIVDKVIAYVAPKFLGGKHALTPISGKGVKTASSAIKLSQSTFKILGEDILVEGYIERG